MIIKGKFNEAVVKSDNIESVATARIFDILNTKITENEKVVIMPNVKNNKYFIDGYTQTMSGDIIDPDILEKDIFSGMLSIRYEKSNDIIEANTIKPSKKDKYKEFKKFLKINLEKARSKYPKIFNIKGLGEIDKVIKNTLSRLKISELDFKDHLGFFDKNDFIRFGYDEESNWVFIKAGSNIVGKAIWKYWKTSISKSRIIKKDMVKDEKEIKSSKESIFKIKEKINTLHKSKKNVKLPDRFIHYKDDLIMYFQDIYFAKIFSEYNRLVLLEDIKTKIKLNKELDRVETIFNSIDFDDLIIRTESSKSYNNKVAIVMNNKIIIGEGMSNESWNYSCPSNINEDSLNKLIDTVKIYKIIDTFTEA